MEIRNGVELIQTSFGDKRPLNLVLFRGGENVLVDTGLVGTPTQGIFPQLEQIGVAPEDLSTVFVTHAHADHFGGNEEIERATEGKVRFCAHHIDQPFIEDPPRYTREGSKRFVDFGVMSVQDLEEGIREAGSGVKVGVPLKGGETFNLGRGLELEVHFLPGHTLGNIALLEKSTGTFVIGETLCGTSQLNLDGEVLSICNYDDVEVYLKTISQFAQIDFDLVILSHIDRKNRREMFEFMKESVKLVRDFDDEVQQRLAEAGEGATSVEIWKTLDGLWDRYRADMGMYYLLETHLKSLLRRGAIVGSFEEGFRWTGKEAGELTETCDDLLSQLAKG